MGHKCRGLHCEGCGQAAKGGAALAVVVLLALVFVGLAGDRAARRAAEHAAAQAVDFVLIMVASVAAFGLAAAAVTVVIVRVVRRARAARLAGQQPAPYAVTVRLARPAVDIGQPERRALTGRITSPVADPLATVRDGADAPEPDWSAWRRPESRDPQRGRSW